MFLRIPADDFAVEANCRKYVLFSLCMPTSVMTMFLRIPAMMTLQLIVASMHFAEVGMLREK